MNRRETKQEKRKVNSMIKIGKYYRISKTGKLACTSCPVCGRINKHLVNERDCKHVARITKRGIVLYHWNRPIAN